MTIWLVAKYMPDLRRREPRNVGVVVVNDNTAVARFLGESAAGTIDGRSVRFIGSVAVYRQWVRHWRHLASTSPGELVEIAKGRAVDENYFLEPGGEIVLGGTSLSPLDVLDDVYTSLVDDTPDASQESVAELADRVIRPLRDRLPKPIVAETVVEVTVDDKIDELRFDYRYNNGVPHLMQRVSLSFGDQRSWDRVHATAWSFSRVLDDPAFQGAHCIALYKPRDQDSALDKQLGQLERFAHTVDVSEPESAVEKLESLLEPA